MFIFFVLPTLLCLAMAVIAALVWRDELAKPVIFALHLLRRVTVKA
jgi:hypothetical protein